MNEKTEKLREQLAIHKYNRRKHTKMDWLDISPHTQNLYLAEVDEELGICKEAGLAFVPVGQFTILGADKRIEEISL